MSMEPEAPETATPEGVSTEAATTSRHPRVLTQHALLSESGVFDIGRIRAVKLGPEDHGIFAFWVHCDFGGSVQGYGPYALDTYDKTLKRRTGTAAGLELLMRFYAWAGVSDLRDTVRLPLVAERHERGWGSDIVRLWRLPCDGGAVFDIPAIFAEYGIGRDA